MLLALPSSRPFNIRINYDTVIRLMHAFTRYDDHLQEALKVYKVIGFSPSILWPFFIHDTMLHDVTRWIDDLVV